ncbi:LysR family transcriptional regulator [Cerasicoccus fimbriatus]|uniref:LysR family transcriptional regulator n=1 Tax=Cerasicoccus fimbriatus TaxID=3014554 RepID=UPI0022B432D0|nr:LysR family transcriptional regulator [Cerasicoccus sp. TK19100]
MSLEIHLLRTFCVVAEEENVSRAAERLYLSPPSVSAHIKSLEDELGVRLFTRSSRGMALTEAGRSLWEDAESIIQQTAQLRRKAQSLSQDISGTLRIGINNPPETLYLDEIFNRLGQDFPTLRFDCSFGSSQIILNGLRNDVHEVGFFEGKNSNPDIASIELEERQLVMIAPLAWANDLLNAPVGQLQEYPWIFASEGCSYYKFAHEWQRARGLKIDERIRSVNDDCSTLSFVTSGLGLSIVSKQILNASKYADTVCVLPQFSGSVCLSIGYLKHRQNDGVVQAALKTIQEIWRTKVSTVATTAS